MTEDRLVVAMNDESGKLIEQANLFVGWQEKARLRGVEARRKENPGAIEPGELVRLVRDQESRLGALRVGAKLVDLERGKHREPKTLATAETKKEVEDIATVLGIDLAIKEDVTAVALFDGGEFVSGQMSTRRDWEIAKAACDVAMKHWLPGDDYSWDDIGLPLQSAWVAGVRSAIAAMEKREIWGGTAMFHAYHGSNGQMFDWDGNTQSCKEGWELAAYVVLSLLGIQEPERLEEALGKISDGMWKVVSLPRNLLVEDQAAGIGVQSIVTGGRPKVSSLMEFAPSEDPESLFREYKNRPKETRRWIESIAEGALAVWVGTAEKWKKTSPRMRAGWIGVVEAAMRMMDSKQRWDVSHVDSKHLRAVYFEMIGSGYHVTKAPWGTSPGVRLDWYRIRDFVAGALIDRFGGHKSEPIASIESGSTCASDVKNGDRDRKYELVAHRSSDGEMKWVTEEWMIADHKYLAELNRVLLRRAKEAEDRADHIDGVAHALEAELNYLTRGDR